MADTIGPDPNRRTAVMALVVLPGVDGESIARWMAEASLAVVAPDDEQGAALSARSGEVLAALQSSWWAPPEFRDHWQDDAVVATLAHQQCQDLNELTEPSIWFDERHPMLVDLWLHQGVEIRGVILVWDSPERAISTLRTDGIETLHATALWQYSVLRTLASLNSQRVFVCSRAALGGEGATELGEFLRSCGMAAVLPKPLHDAWVESDAASSDLVDLLHGLAGSHAAFPTVELPPLSEASEELLRAHRSLYRKGVEAKSAWLMADQRARALSHVQADMTQTMKEVDRVVDHLLNAV